MLLNLPTARLEAMWFYKNVYTSRPNMGSGSTFRGAHLVTGKRGELRYA